MWALLIRVQPLVHDLIVIDAALQPLAHPAAGYPRDRALGVRELQKVVVGGVVVCGCSLGAPLAAIVKLEHDFFRVLQLLLLDAFEVLHPSVLLQLEEFCVVVVVAGVTWFVHN